jgi:magnesium transporter
VAIRTLAVRRTDNALLEPAVAEVPALLDDPDVVVWVMLASPEPSAMEVLARVFHFHPLVVEDALASANTPKIEDYGDYLYIIFHGLSAGCERTGKVDMTDLDVFLGPRFVVTHEGREVPAVAKVEAKIRRDPRVLARGASSVVHELFDDMIDRFLPLMDRLDDEVDELEATILSGSHPRTLERIFELKHALQRLRRIGIHQREILHRLSTTDLPWIPAAQKPFFRDVYDHFVRVIDQTDGYREMVASSLDAHLSMQSHRMNEIMKVLTMISTIMLPLNFIAGLYGMNFDQMPGLHWKYGYQAAWVVMTFTGITMYTFFRRRHWL